jgi:hypothetical protein
MPRYRSLDEFESIFEKASIPVFDLPGLELSNCSIVLRDGVLDGSILSLAGYLKARFSCTVQLHWPSILSGEKADRLATENGLKSFGSPYTSTEEMAGQIDPGECQLLLFSEAIHEENRIVELDRLVELVSVPILLVKAPVEDPSSLFRRVLHCLSGNPENIKHLFYSFDIVEPKGMLHLLHTIDESELDDICRVLRASPDVVTQSRNDLLRALEQHAERYLRGAVAATEERSYEVDYTLAFGNVLETVKKELSRQDYGLLVAGTHRAGRSHIAAVDYQLLRLAGEIPVLAL